FPPGRRAGHLDRHGCWLRDDPRLPVQRRAPRRRLPGGARFQPQQHVRLDPDAGRHLRHPGHCQGWLPGERDDLRRGGRRRGIPGVRVRGRRHANAQPPRRPLQRPALVRGDGVRSVRRRPRPPGLRDHPARRNTDLRPVVPGKSTNIFIAGMLPNTTYEMRHVFSDGTGFDPVLFTTGSIPSTQNFPTITVPQPPGPGSDLNQDLLFQSLARPGPNAPYAYATDLAGPVTWYYDAPQAGFLPNRPAQGASLVPGGSVLVMCADGNAPFPMSRNILREIDLAGNSLRETNIDAVNA